MKEFVVTLIILLIFYSLGSKNKKKQQKRKIHREVISEDWTNDFPVFEHDEQSSEDFETTKTEYKNNIKKENKKTGKTMIKENFKNVDKNVFFDAKKAIIYSAILERPYK